MVTLIENLLIETKTWATDKDGIGRILIPKVMVQASSFKEGQLYQIIFDKNTGKYNINPIKGKWTKNKQKD